MELRQPKSFGMLDDHDRGVRYVDANLDHRRGNQDVEIGACKSDHHAIFVRPLHASVDQAHAVLEYHGEMAMPLLRRGKVEGFGFVDQWADPEYFCVIADSAANRRDHLL